MPVVEYHIRDELRLLTVCLYNPTADPSMQFTTDNLSCFILDCAYQLKVGDKVRRIPFYISPSQVDAMRAIEWLRQTLSEMRRATETESMIATEVAAQCGSQDQEASKHTPPMGKVGNRPRGAGNTSKETPMKKRPKKDSI